MSKISVQKSESSHQGPMKAVNCLSNGWLESTKRILNYIWHIFQKKKGTFQIVSITFYKFPSLKIMSKTVEKNAQPSIDMEALAEKKLEDTTFADLVSSKLAL